MDQMNQRILRSVLVVFRRIRLHQADYIKHACSPEACRRFFAEWADSAHWSSTQLAPTLDDSLFQSTTWTRLSLTSVVGEAPVPLLGDSTAESEDERLLTIHVRLTMGALRHMLGYGRLPQSPPWSFVRLLYCQTGGKACSSILGELRAFWSITVYLETSHDRFHLELADQLPMTRWTVYREPMQLLERAAWDSSSPWYPLALSYIKAMWEGVTNTMGLENGFNDLRDNEIRGARHKARSDSTIHALAISSLCSRYKETVGMVVVGPEDMGSQARFHCKASIYKGEAAPTTAASIGVDPGGLVTDRAAWPSTNSDTFNQTQLALLRVLTVAPPTAWPKLWMARLLREHMVVTEVLTNKVFYVLGCTKWTALLLELSLVGGDGAWITADASAFHGCVPVVALDQYRCHTYAVVSESSHGGLRMGFHLDEVTSMLAYCCQHWLHLLQVKTLLGICAALTLQVRRNASQLELAIAVLTCCAVSEEVMADMVARIKAIMAKRCRKTKSQPSQHGDTAEQGQEEDERDEEEEAHGPVLVPDILNDLAAGEVDFVLGKVDASKAITEEETDEALDRLSEAAAAAATGPAAKRPRVAKPPSAASSSRDPVALPPSEEEPDVDAMEVVENTGPPDLPEAGAPEARPLRVPAAEDLVSPHVRCALRMYARPGVAPYWIASLPQGLVFEGRRTHSRVFHTPAGELLARQLGYAWLVRAVAAGVLG
jgi:hypothetical protein